MLWYLGSPYTRYKDGPEAAYREACKAAGELLRRGLEVYSPIAHSHPISEHGEIDPLDHDFWLARQAQFIARCDGLLIVMMPGWQDSVGVKFERECFEKAKKPVLYWQWPVTALPMFREAGGTA